MVYFKFNFLKDEVFIVEYFGKSRLCSNCKIYLEI